MSTVVDIGTYVPEHLCRVPPGALVVEMKYCEMCGRSFPRSFAPTEPFLQKERDGTYSGGRGYYSQAVLCERRRDRGRRFCRKCLASPLPELRAEELLTAQENYKAQLPATENQMQHATHLPKYERPIGRETSAHRVANRGGQKPGQDRCKILERAQATRLTVMAAFAERRELSLEDLQALIPDAYRSTDVHSRLHGLRIFPVLVRRIRKEGIRGNGIGVYALPETIN